MTRLTTREAINRVLAAELARDRRTVYLGETVRDIGATGASRGLFERFGPTQVIETPVSENGIFGAALGLALAGYRPIVEIYSADFALAVANEIISDIPKWRQQHARSGELPITIRGWMGASGGLGPEHSQCMEAYFHHAPGLTIVVPGTVADMAGLLRSAIRSPDPVLFLEHRRLYDLADEVSDDPEFSLAMSCSEVVMPGSDVTLVAWAWMRQEASAAASKLALRSISVELIDPRTIKPMELSTILESVRRTGHLVVAEESPITGSVGAEIIARTIEAIDRPIRATRVAMPDMIHPYSASMECDILPDTDLIIDAVHALLAGKCASFCFNDPLRVRNPQQR
jgi:pyruvate/2-oxoglutarate/acetoin dehydrogenase E1 component